MSQPTESDELEALDRRARAATDGLADAVAAFAIPDPPLAEPDPGDRRSSRRFVPLVAAAAVLVALVGVALGLAGGDDADDAVAGQPPLTHLVLPDPESAGYELSAAFDGTEAKPSSTGSLDVTVTVHGPATGDDPWASGVLSYSLPASVTTLDGEVLNLGDVEASYTTDGIAATVGWVEGDEVRYLVSSLLSRDELVDLARATIAEGTPEGAPLPGQRALFAGSIADVFPTLGVSIGAPEGLHGVAYAEVDGDGGLVVATRSGDETRWRAASVVAASTERVTVRGSDAVVAHFGADPSVVEVSWLEPDGTLVRAGTVTTSDTDSLVALLDQLESIDDDAFAELVRTHPAGSGLEESDSEISADEIGEGSTDSAGPRTTPVASVEQQSGDQTYRATLERAQDGSLTLEAAVEGPEGGSGTAIQLPDPEVAGAVRNDRPDGTVVIAAVVGPHQGSVEVRDATSGELVEHDGGSEATIEGSDHTVVLLVAAGVRSGRALVVVATAPDGGEITIPV